MPAPAADVACLTISSLKHTSRQALWSSGLSVLLSLSLSLSTDKEGHLFTEELRRASVGLNKEKERERGWQEIGIIATEGQVVSEERSIRRRRREGEEEGQASKGADRHITPTAELCVTTTTTERNRGKRVLLPPSSSSSSPKAAAAAGEAAAAAIAANKRSRSSRCRPFLVPRLSIRRPMRVTHESPDASRLAERVTDRCC